LNDKMHALRIARASNVDIPSSWTDGLTDVGKCRHGAIAMRKSRRSGHFAHPDTNQE